MDRDELISRYIDGHMSAAEEAAFLKQLEVDPALRELLGVDLALQQAAKRELQQLPQRRKYPSSVFLAQLTPSVDPASKAWYKRKKITYTIGIISLAILGMLLVPLFRTDQPSQPSAIVRTDSVMQAAPVDTTKRAQSTSAQKIDSVQQHDTLPKAHAAKSTVGHDAPHATTEQEENEPPRVYSNGVHVDINKQKENPQK